MLDQQVDPTSHRSQHSLGLLWSEHGHYSSLLFQREWMNKSFQNVLTKHLLARQSHIWKDYTTVISHVQRGLALPPQALPELIFPMHRVGEMGQKEPHNQAGVVCFEWYSIYYG